MRLNQPGIDGKPMRCFVFLFLFASPSPDAPPPIPHAADPVPVRQKPPGCLSTLTPAEQICFQVVDGHPVAAILDTGEHSPLSRRSSSIAARGSGGHAALATLTVAKRWWIRRVASHHVAAHTVHNLA